MTYWSDIERRWQGAWHKSKMFEAEPDSRPKKTITVAYPYPNSPQHVGHGRTYTITDVHARYWRMKGYNVLFPMAFHYTGTPILGMARRVQAKDDAILSGLRDVFNVPVDAIKTFTEPLSIADYFRNEIKQGMMEMGYSIDWRREFATIDEPYRRFITWQIRLLHQKGLITQGTHPVGWCPVDGNPVSQHDTLGDVEPEITEYTLVKFQWNGYIIPTATLRPETIFGVTNIWINPDITYDICDVDGERWVVSAQCTQKMAHLGHDITRISTIRGRDMIHENAISSLGQTIPILPASFVKPDTGTGAVMSVPAHSVYDYAALQDFGKSDIAPIQVIESPGYGACPAQEIYEESDIAGQNDPKLEEATTKLYNKEFYEGTLLDRCESFAGMTVSECKDDITVWLQDQKGALSYLEISGTVRCRCGAKCVVKMLDNQWFLDYGRESWKDTTKKHLENMSILPPEISSEFFRVVDWLRARACARQQGMGTKLPWDSGWIIESLTDSTIYMAFYIVMKFVQEGIITADMMDKKFFDYVFLGVGPAPDIPHIQAIRREFLYYYPVDARHSGRDLVPNHLTFFVMNHVAIFPPRMWPRQIIVNGSVLMDGKKMSKSMGNIVPLRAAIRKHGADPIRLGIIMSAELLQDADISLDSVSGISARLRRMIQECGVSGDRDWKPVHVEDYWLKAKIGVRLDNIGVSMQKMRLREALHDILYGIESDYAWYRRRQEARGGVVSPNMIRWLCRLRARLLSPFAPHAAEQMWHTLNEPGLVIGQMWPERSGSDEDVARYIHSEHLMISILEDITKISKIADISPRRIRVYVDPVSEPYYAVLNNVLDGKAEMRDVMKNIASDPAKRHLRRKPEKISKCLKDILNEPVEIRRARMQDDAFDEASLMRRELKWVIRTRYDAEVSVYVIGDDAIEDPGNKAGQARPFKPAIFIE